MKTLRVDGVTLHYQDVGEGRPVLLFHAFPLSSEAFAPQLSVLSNRFRFIVPDLRGFGRSGIDGDVTEMRRFAQDGLAILDALEIGSAVVGGVSMGGYISMALLDEDPGRVEALVLVDTQHTADDEAGRKVRQENAQLIEQNGVEHLVKTLVPKVLADDADASLRENIVRIVRANSPRGPAAATRGMGLRSDSRDILARFGGRALVVVGEKDPITPVEKARKLADLISGAKLEIIPGAGHLPNQEKPEQFNRVLSEFLSTR